MVMIDNCEFGGMTIGDKIYTSDLIIYPDGSVADNWWRKSGHRFTIEDMQALLTASPSVIVSGIGMYGRVHINSSVKSKLAELGIELVAMRTKQAADEFNRRIQLSEKVAGCFHLTC